VSGGPFISSLIYDVVQFFVVLAVWGSLHGIPELPHHPLRTMVLNNPEIYQGDCKKRHTSFSLNDRRECRTHAIIRCPHHLRVHQTVVLIAMCRQMPMRSYIRICRTTFPHITNRRPLILITGNRHIPQLLTSVCRLWSSNGNMLPRPQL